MAINRFLQMMPRSEDLVVSHGDYCLPNVLIEEGRATGFVDLGELGVADRWWDLSVASWSITWNLGAGYEALFLEAYGAELDDERRQFHRLLYDVVS
jgi:aminoglycoside phosphotransferase